MTSSPSDAGGLPIEFSWAPGVQTGWGLLGLHMALGLSRHGHRVYLGSDADLRGVPMTLLPTIGDMLQSGDVTERRIRFDFYGNHWPKFEEAPNRFRVLLCVFEDSAIPDKAVEQIKRYDLILAPSRWAQGILAAKGVESTLWHQGYDDTLFTPAPRRRPANDGRFLIFSGGKLEFRKGQDIVIEAFRRFRDTKQGDGAILVTAWQNRWPATMQGIWESGYVKGVPVTRNGSQDIKAWLQANGIPGDQCIDLGMPSQAELANAIRECDVALFPNRCEGATNMVLPEVLGCGVPCIVSQNAGHLDVGSVFNLDKQPPVTLPCPLFNGFDGWGESDPADCVEALQYVRSLHEGREGVRDAGAAEYARATFGWHAQAAELHRLITEATTK